MTKAAHGITLVAAVLLRDSDSGCREALGSIRHSSLVHHPAFAAKAAASAE
jgi:hypothetical protein